MFSNFSTSWCLIFLSFFTKQLSFPANLLAKTASPGPGGSVLTQDHGNSWIFPANIEKKQINKYLFLYISRHLQKIYEISKVVTRNF